MTGQTQIYVLYYIEESIPIPFYVGKSFDPSGRLYPHRRDATDPMNPKEAYAFLREHNIKEFETEVVEGKSERELVTELTLLGQRLYNSNAGIRSAAKKRRDDTFAILNREADARLAPA